MPRARARHPQCDSRFVSYDAGVGSEDEWFSAPDPTKVPAPHAVLSYAVSWWWWMTAIRQGCQPAGAFFSDVPRAAEDGRNRGAQSLWVGDPGFPEPTAILSGIRVWVTADVEKWARKAGRIK